MVAGQRGRRRDDDDDYEELVLELLTAQLRTQQRISRYLGFFFWQAFIALLLVVGAAVGVGIAYWLN